MFSKKTSNIEYDVVANVSKYKDSEGRTKFFRQKVGRVVKSDNGNLSLVLNGLFNPAGLKQDNNGHVWLDLDKLNFQWKE